MYTGKETANVYKNVATAKTQNVWYKTLILAIFAGVFIAFAGLVATIAGTASQGTASTLIKAAVFPIGLILVVLTGSELFTGNCLLLAPALTKDIKTVPLLKNLGIVYLGNIVGSALVALIAVYSGIMSDTVVNAAIATAAYKCGTDFGEALLRAIPCNVLVCFAVWCATACKSSAGKVLAVYPPIFAFIACGFEHSVANMYYLLSGLLASAKYGIAATNLNLGNALLYSLLPSTLGNVIGGMLFVALPLWLVFFRQVTKHSASNTDADNGSKTETENAE